MALNRVNKTVSVLPSQLKFLKSDKKKVLFSGAYGAGKSRALCFAAARQASIPNNTVLLIRKTLKSLKNSTLPVLIEGKDPVLMPGSYEHNKSDNIININEGGKIYLLGIDDPVRLRSINAGCICVDESIELNLTEYLELLGRLRGEEGSRQIYMATNPGLPNHFLYKRFFLNKDSDSEVIVAKTAENIYLPKDYITNLQAELPPALFKRYVEGIWSATERAIFDNFNRDIHANNNQDYMLPSLEEYYIGLDMGYTHPAAVILAGRAGNRLYILQEWRESKKLIDDIIGKICEFAKICPLQPKVIVDPSAASVIAKIEADGFDVVKANNDVLGGINRIRQRLVIRGDSPDLIINDTCTKLIEEIESYQFEGDKEKPVKLGDDLCDVLRYICNYVDDKATTPSQVFAMSIDNNSEYDND